MDPSYQNVAPDPDSNSIKLNDQIGDKFRGFFTPCTEINSSAPSPFFHQKFAIYGTIAKINDSGTPFFTAQVHQYLAV